VRTCSLLYCLSCFTEYVFSLFLFNELIRIFPSVLAFFFFSLLALVLLAENRQIAGFFRDFGAHLETHTQQSYHSRYNSIVEVAVIDQPILVCRVPDEDAGVEW
jgi:hypothetical protein